MSEKIKFNFKGLYRSLIISFLITIVLVIIIASITYFTDISDRLTSLLLFLASVISTVSGGMLLAKHCEGRGLLHGLILGLIYFIVMILISTLINHGFIISSKSLIMLVADICGGMFGGIWGINLKK